MKGRCLSGDYELINSASGDGSLESLELICRCKCGDKYVLKYNSFMQLSEDGTMQPYMERKNRLSKWQKAQKELSIK